MLGQAGAIWMPVPTRNNRTNTRLPTLTKKHIINGGMPSCGVMNRNERWDLAAWYTPTNKALNIRSLEMVRSYCKCAHPECSRFILTPAIYCQNHNPPPAYTISDEYVRMVLARGIVALIDKDDIEEITPYRWYCNADGYAVRESKIGEIFGKNITELAYMHRVVMESALNRCLSPHELVDHANGDRLDNRRSNLRISTKMQNRRNSKKRTDDTSSRYKGVIWHKSNKGWVARITIDKKLISLGRFEREKDAALAYNKAATEHFGEFAYLNNIEEESPHDG